MKIIEKIKNYGILVIRALLGRRSKSARLGAAIVGLGLLYGASQASSITRAISQIFGQAEVARKESPTTNLTASKQPASTTASTAALQPEADTGSPSLGANVVDLIAGSDTIVRGGVVDVSDGIENGVPYTEVTLDVSEAIRGNVGDKMTIRQFGLKEPRLMEDGRMNLMVTPAGWAKYEAGEDVVLFLNPSARLTGLRATVGLAQGKFDVKAGNVMNEAGNLGLFDDVDMQESLKTDRDKRLLATKKGPVNADSFASFVRRAVKEGWVEGGKLRHAKK